MIRSKYFHGALVYYETHLRRWIDAIGADVIKYVDDFVRIPVDDTTGDPTEYTQTVVEAGAGNSTATSQGLRGGQSVARQVARRVRGDEEDGKKGDEEDGAGQGRGGIRGDGNGQRRREQGRRVNRYGISEEKYVRQRLKSTSFSPEG